MSRDAAALNPVFSPLYEDIDPNTLFNTQKPLLAHYTTISTLEKIMQSGTVWLSNPLYMNDIEEVKVSINEGMDFFLQSPTIKEAHSADDYVTFQRMLALAYHKFDTLHLFDTYILCLSEHVLGDDDGLLSMWRVYGDSGRGAAIIFDAGAINSYAPSPLLIVKVDYGTPDDRKRWFERTAEKFASLVRANVIIGETEASHGAQALFSRLRLFSLFTKDSGFREEREWRVAYLPERDFQGVFKPYLSYSVGPRGVEPKLKIPVRPVPELGDQAISLEGIIHKIMLGPSLSSPLAVQAAKRMLHTLGKAELSTKVVASRIPYRPAPEI